MFDVYDALMRSKHWDDTMLIVTYDEHGGFYDHVPPPPLPTAEEGRRYGVRVPALFAGPRIRRQVLHEPARAEGLADRDQPHFDHTTLIKTFLLAFANEPERAIAEMPARVQRAPNLGSILLAKPRTDLDEPRNEGQLVEAWRREARERREAQRANQRTSGAPGEGTRSVAPDGAGQPLVLTDFQAEWHKFAIAMRSMGVDA